MLKKNDIKDEQSISKKEEDPVCPITREYNPSCESTDNNEIVRSRFPLFLGEQDATYINIS